MLLSETKVRHAKPASKDRWLHDGAGLYLRVRSGGSKVWIIRRKRRGKTQIITLGQYPTVGLKEARLKASQYQLRQDVSNATVQDLADKYMAVVNITHDRPRFVDGYMRRAILPAIGSRKARDVQRSELVEIIEDYRPRGERSADQLRSNLRQLFAYAVELGYRDDNPALAIGRRVTGYSPKARERTLSNDEIRLLWREDHPNAALLRFLLLTGLRISEAQKGHRKGLRWVVPAKVTKSGREHWVYLTKTAAAQLEQPFKVSPTAVQAWLRRWCERHDIEPRFRPHDLRRTFVTRLNDDGKTPPYIIERCVDPCLQGVMAVYSQAEYEKERIAAARRMETLLLEVVHTDRSRLQLCVQHLGRLRWNLSNGTFSR